MTWLLKSQVMQVHTSPNLYIYVWYENFIANYSSSIHYLQMINYKLQLLFCRQEIVMITVMTKYDNSWFNKLIILCQVSVVY